MAKRIFLTVVAGWVLMLGLGSSILTAQAINGNTPQTNQTSPTNQTNTPQTQAGEPVDLNKGLIDFNQPVQGNFGTLLNRVINVLLGLIAGVSVIFIIIGGFRLAFSQGKTEAVTAGKKTITWAIAGLVVALLAFAIVRIVERIVYP